MSYFFTPHPFVAYDPTGQNTPSLAIDITRRFRLSEISRNNSLIFYNYDVKDSDRPDIMAEKYYQDPRLDWLFFITNNIFDPYFQWPLNQKQFEDYVRQKYGSTSSAQALNHHYEKIIQSRSEQVIYDGERIVIPERSLQVDYATYILLAPSVRRNIDCFTFEENENNRKRTIKILDAAFVPDVMREFEEIFVT